MLKRLKINGIGVLSILTKKDVGKGPNGEAIFHIVSELVDNTFRHVLGCPSLKIAVEIVEQKEKDIPEENLKEDIISFQQGLVENRWKGIR